MKLYQLFCSCILLVVLRVNVDAVRLVNRRGHAQDRTITQIVKLLQGMLDASKADADTEAEAYGKYKCYADTQIREKTESVATLTKQIALLTSEIEELMSANGQLSKDVAQLKEDMAANVLARDQADKLRADEKAAFDTLDADLTSAIAQLGQAIDALGEIGADQDLAEGEVSADHEQFMAGYKAASLVKVKSQVKKAMLLAKTFLTDKHSQHFKAFLEEPFTGTYTSQSGEVIGILKNMEETFKANLKAAKEAEEKAIKAHAKFIETKTEEWNIMDASSIEKQGQLSANDEALTSKKGLHTTAVQQKADDEAFLELMKPMAAQKAREWEARQTWRANEQAAISEAIAILDSDKSFKAFGKVEATRTGATGFLQLSSTRRNSLRQGVPVNAAKAYLQQAASVVHSARLAKIAALLAQGNPFTVVIKAIEGVKEHINAEAAVDKKQFDWCADERQKNNADLEARTNEIVSLTASIDTLDDTINNEATGLKALIEQTETDLTTNSESQTEETATRRAENEQYQKEATACEDATEILKQAIAILNKYYADMEAEYIKELSGFVQEDPAPPETWDATYKGQGDQGNKVIEMLNFVLSETHKEATALHDAEASAQHAFEDSMQLLKTAEEDLQGQLVRQKKDLADAEAELASKRVDLEKTEKVKAAIERYLESIKPGCDFITDHYTLREESRGKELAALDNAIEKLKGTAGFAKATRADKHAAWEEQGCKEICVESEEHAKCKACLAKVSVPGYCAGHPSAQGCSS